jgi:hypothetical protein
MRKARCRSGYLHCLNHLWPCRRNFFLLNIQGAAHSHNFWALILPGTYLPSGAASRERQRGERQMPIPCRLCGLARALQALIWVLNVECPQSLLPSHGDSQNGNFCPCCQIPNKRRHGRLLTHLVRAGFLRRARHLFL